MKKQSNDFVTIKYFKNATEGKMRINHSHYILNHYYFNCLVWLNINLFIILVIKIIKMKHVNINTKYYMYIKRQTLTLTFLKEFLSEIEKC